MAAKIADPLTQDPTDAFPFLTAVSEMLATVGINPGNNYMDVYNPPVWPGANPSGSIEGGYLNVLDDLSTFITNNPSTQIFMVNGLYDFSCPAAEVKYMLTISAMPWPRRSRPRATSRAIRYTSATPPITCSFRIWTRSTTRSRFRE